MHVLLAMTAHSFAQLRRDKVFMPVLMIGLIIALFASMASQWTLEGFRKVLFDMGLTGFYLTGTAVAILWGTKSIIDAGSDGGMEIELAAPIGRSTWLVGKFLGLSFTMLLFMVFLTVIWQIIMGFSGFGWLAPHQLVTFGFLWVSWLVVCATALFFATFCSHAVAQFVSACVWVLGMTIDTIAKTMLQKTSELLRGFIEFLAKIWDLQQLNLIEYATNPSLLTTEEVWVRLAYGGMIILILVTASCWVISRRNIIG